MKEQDEIYEPQFEEIVGFNGIKGAIYLRDGLYLRLFGTDEDPEYLLNCWKNGAPVDIKYNQHIVIYGREKKYERLSGEIVQCGINLLPPDYEFCYFHEGEKLLKVMTLPISRSYNTVEEMRLLLKGVVEYIYVCDKPEDFPVGHIVNIEDATPYQRKYYRPIRLKK